jgi:putative membrane protein
MKNGVVLIILLALLAVIFFSFVGHGHMWGWQGGMGYGHGYGGGYMWILLLVVIGILVYLILRNVPSGPGSDKESALDILKKRFAKGEITQQEYDEMKRKLLE